MKEHQKLLKEFYNLTRISIPYDGLLSIATNCIQIDIFKFDELLASKDKEYNADECTYKGKPTSMGEYIKIKFGNRAYEIIETLLK